MRWEYCRIEYGGWVWQRKQRQYALTIWYFGNGTQPISLANKEDEGWEYDPLPVALFQLGHYGWELVSTQHANIPDKAPWVYSNQAALDNEIVIFYFKRPIIEGRAVSEPPLQLRITTNKKGRD